MKLKIDQRKLAVLRAERMWTISKLCEEANVSEPTTRRGREISPMSAGKIAKALGVNVLDILSDE